MKRLLIFSVILFSMAFFLPFQPAVSQQTEPETGVQTAELKKESALVSLDFENAEIRDVIKVIAMASGMNMVIGEDVKAKVTISLKDVPWEKALDIILRTYNFSYKKEENLIRIMTFAKVKQEERDIPLMTKIVYLNFADVEALKDSLASVLSDRGSIEIDERTNSMLVTDIPARVEQAEQIARELDTRTPQVLIEAMLVDVKLTDDDELGINWNILHTDRHFPWQDKTSSDNYIQQPSGTMNTMSNQSIKIGWLQRLGTFRLDGLIQAWISQAKANVLASPKIVTLDNQTAKIEIKSQAPYYQISETEQGSMTSTQFKDVVTGLEVTPHITKEGFISMNVKPRQEFIEAWRDSSAGDQPQIGTRSAETNVLVRDGETIVIGGLRKVEDNATITKVPLLGDLPLIGSLFRKRDIQQINTELVMFVTPRIIIHPEMTEEEEEHFEMLEEARGEFWDRHKDGEESLLEKIPFFGKSKKEAEEFAYSERRPDVDEEIIIADEECMPEPVAAAEEEITEEELEDEYIYVW